MGPCDVCGQDVNNDNGRTVVFTTGKSAPRHFDCSIKYKHIGCGGEVMETHIGTYSRPLCSACNIVLDEDAIVEKHYIKGVEITTKTQ